MPRGGSRPNSGRPTKEEAAKKAKLLALAIKQGPQITSRQFLDGLMRDPSASKVMRMQAAIALSKLPPEDRPAAAVSPPIQPIILAIPRGCFLSEEQIANIDQLIPHGVPIEPHTGTADWTKTTSADRREQPASEPVVERLEVVKELPVPQDGPGAERDEAAAARAGLRRGRAQRCIAPPVRGGPVQLQATRPIRRGLITDEPLSGRAQSLIPHDKSADCLVQCPVSPTKRGSARAGP